MEVVKLAKSPGPGTTELEGWYNDLVSIIGLCTDDSVVAALEDLKDEIYNFLY